MKYFTLLALPLLLTGCFANYRQSVELDLLPEDSAAQLSAMPTARIGVIRNNSGAGLPIVIRLKDGLVETDEYARWLMSPDQMLERELHRTLNTTDFTSVRLTGNVLTCEFDRSSQQAVLEVSFEARKGKHFKRLKKRFTAPVKLKDNSDAREQASAMAKAMSICYRQACLAAADLINEVNKQNNSHTTKGE
ncbi:MAG: hypothetical protein IJZ19_04115 [Lentisphaeria bacterium]|nr:hypothetical protein [Lentisphaeria bacterium]MBQ8754192.1 hypothetical protein [Lentisphaeria bacterium]